MFTLKTKILLAAVLCMILVVSGADIFGITAHAQGIGTRVSGSLGGDLVKFMEKLAMFNTFLHIILLVILQFLGYLLQADFFNDPQMMGSLYSIWRLSRDIMNIIFAVMLIGVSFYVIITSKSDMIKDKIVTFIIAVILVNMSWFFPRVILDVANVLTATIYSLPNSLGIECQQFDDGDPPRAVPCRVVTAVVIFPSPPKQKAFCKEHAGGKTAACSCITDIECHVTQDYDEARATMKPAHAMINGMAVSFAKITLLPKVPASMPKGDASTTSAVLLSFQIAINIMMALMVQVAVVLPLLALAVGLLIRIIIIWITTAFMPFSFLGYVMTGKLGTAVFEGAPDIWKEFLNAAFLPAIVGVPFSIGFIMLSAVAKTTTFPMASTPLEIDVPLLVGVTSWWAILWLFAAIGIMWVGAFTALKRSAITAKFTEKIKGFGEQIFGGLIQAPLLVPIPLPGAGPGTNLGTLVHGPKIVADAVRVAASGTSGKDLGTILGERFGGGAGAAPTNPADLARSLAAEDRTRREIVAAINRMNLGGNNTADVKDIMRSANMDKMKTIDALTMLRDSMKHGDAHADLNKPDLILKIEQEIAAENARAAP